MEICAKLSEGTFVSNLITYLEKKNSQKIKNAIEKFPNLSYINIEQLLKCDNPLLFDEIFLQKYMDIELLQNIIGIFQL